MISGLMACRFLAVSISVSPFVAELEDAEILKVSPLIRLPAISKDTRVRVDGSKKKLTIVFPRRVGTFLMGRLPISLKERAVEMI